MFSTCETTPVKVTFPAALAAPPTPRPSLQRNPSATKANFFSRFNGTMRRSRSSTVAGPPARPESLPRSMSVVSWFSDDSEDEDEGKRPWKFAAMATIKRKRSRATTPTSSLGSPFSLAFTFSPSPPLTPHLGRNFFLPPARPLDLDFGLDFLSPSSGPSPNAHSRPNRERHSFDESSLPSRARRGISWSPTTASPKRNTVFAARRTDDFYNNSDWADAFSISSPRFSRSPEMTEVDDEDDPTWTDSKDVPHTPKAARVNYEEHRQLFDFLSDDNGSYSPPNKTFLSRAPTPPQLRATSSFESLLDPRFASLPVASPTSLSSFGFEWPIPSSTPTTPTLLPRTLSPPIRFGPECYYSRTMASTHDLFYDCD
ncbi:hypothetical protein JCM11641_003693 [Rhodosporidiobolus odoratus]